MTKVFDPTVADHWFELCYWSNVAHIEDFDPNTARNAFIRIKGETLRFRAFVQDNKVVGISNFSTTRPLEYKEHIRDYLNKVANATLELAKKQTLPLKFPTKTKGTYEKNNFVCDFYITKDGSPVFVGGYLPHSPNEDWSEDSCCFPVGNVEGLALQPNFEYA